MGSRSSGVERSGQQSPGQNPARRLNISALEYIPCITGSEPEQCPSTSLSGFALFLSLAIVSTSILSITLIRRSDKLFISVRSRMMMYMAINNLIFALISSPFNMCQWTQYLYITQYLCQIHATFFLTSAGIMLMLVVLMNYDVCRATAQPWTYHGEPRKFT